jgi:hypothetical protein
VTVVGDSERYVGWAGLVACQNRRIGYPPCIVYSCLPPPFNPPLHLTPLPSHTPLTPHPYFHIVPTPPHPTPQACPSTSTARRGWLSCTAARGGLCTLPGPPRPSLWSSGTTPFARCMTGEWVDEVGWTWVRVDWRWGCVMSGYHPISCCVV